MDPSELDSNRCWLPEEDREKLATQAPEDVEPGNKASSKPSSISSRASENIASSSDQAQPSHFLPDLTWGTIDFTVPLPYDYWHKPSSISSGASDKIASSSKQAPSSRVLTDLTSVGTVDFANLSLSDENLQKRTSLEVLEHFQPRGKAASNPSSITSGASEKIASGYAQAQSSHVLRDLSALGTMFDDSEDKASLASSEQDPNSQEHDDPLVTYYQIDQSALDNLICKASRAGSSQLPQRDDLDEDLPSDGDDQRTETLKGSRLGMRDDKTTFSLDKSSAWGSIHTTITSPDPDPEDFIDAGISYDEDLEHIVNATTYYKELSFLRFRTAQICGIEKGPSSQDSSLNDWQLTYEKAREGLYHLQSEGFCGELMSIIVEDKNRLGVATTVHVSLYEINLLRDISTNMENIFSCFDDPYLDRRAKSLQELLGKLLGMSVNTPPATSSRWTSCVQFMINAISVGLVAFSGSHSCRFDCDIWQEPVDEITVGLGNSFRPRRLACLGEFIGGPIWVLGWSQGISESHEDGLKLSLTVQDLQELWGPVWFVRGTRNEGPIIRTARGYIVPLPRSEQPYPQLQEVECHWVRDLREYMPEDESSILLTSTSRILIGTDTLKATTLSVNENCGSKIADIQASNARHLQIPGTFDAYYHGEGYEVQLTGGQFVNAGFVKKYKEYPGRMMRDEILEKCTKPNTRLMPLLNLRIGLELSACTGNAQRVTLWDALRLSQTLDRSFTDESSCEHKVGDPKCVQKCWTRCRPTDDIDSSVNIPKDEQALTQAEVRRIIGDAIVALEHTGVDQKGNLQAFWPFTDHPRTWCITPTSPTRSNNWFHVIKEAPNISTFAVVSHRCLEFKQQTVLSREFNKCQMKGDCNTKPPETVLSTQVLLAPSLYVYDKILNAFVWPTNVCLGGATLTVRENPEIHTSLVIVAVLKAKFGSRLMRAVARLGLPVIHEHVDPNLTTGVSVSLIVH